IPPGCLSMRRLLLVLAFGLLATACTDDDTFEMAGDVDVPRLDRSVSAVPLDEVVFDTFDGGSVPLSEADDATVDRLLDAIPPIDEPAFESPADATWLDDDDLVIVVERGDTTRAYPVLILDLHEIVHDEVGGESLVVTYCPLCGSALVFDRTTEDGPVTFSNTSALYENDMVMVDRETGSYWWQTAGRAIVGPRTGDELTLVSSRMDRFGVWRAANPDGEVLVRPVEGRDYSRDRFATYGATLDAGRTPFPVSPEVFDDTRLAPSTRVTIAEIDGVWTAWPDGTEPDLGDTPTASMYWFAAAGAYPGLQLG
ncbi:MAG: DUF3179 domain-containing (seleno)protein, partial [Actinomycetota bacterium]